MRRNKTVPANAILVADLHLTSKTPISRTDNYIQAQERKLKFLRELSQKNNNCPVLCAGDVFDHWKASPWLCSWAHRFLPDNFVTIPGNHDLPMHSIKEYDKSALSLLETVERLTVLKNENMVIYDMEIAGVPFGELENFSPPKTITKKRAKILLLHELIWPGKRPIWAKHSYSASEILDRFGEHFDLIVSGDNHQSFVIKEDDCILVNPGSIMRSTAAQLDFQPRCYLFWAEKKMISAVNFPIEQEVHKIDYLTEKKERDKRISAYIEKMNDNWEKGLSFQDNLRAFFQENKTPRKVRELIWEHLEMTT